MLLASAGFLVPFMFVYGPALLLDGTVPEILLAMATGLAGVTALAAAAMGFLRSELRMWERLVLGAAALALMFPGLMSDGFGLAALFLIFIRSDSGAKRR
jgi:TRAP-type uncharacterized transport system fused permease subunit